MAAKIRNFGNFFNFVYYTYYSLKGPKWGQNRCISYRFRDICILKIFGHVPEIQDGRQNGKFLKFQYNPTIYSTSSEWSENEVEIALALTVTEIISNLISKSVGHVPEHAHPCPIVPNFGGPLPKVIIHACFKFERNPLNTVEVIACQNIGQNMCPSVPDFARSCPI